MVAASVGGSAIEFWLSDAARADKSCGGVQAGIAAACPNGSKPLLDQSTSASAPAANFNNLRSAELALKEEGWTPSCFYNAMVHPIGKYMKIAAIMWDQGEADYAHTCAHWGCNLASLAQSWRGAQLFNDPSIVMTYDQMLPDLDHAGGAGLPEFDHPGGIPNSTFTTRLDLQTCLRNATSAGHAVRKLEVGRRLALALRVALYKEPPTPLSFGPSISAVAVKATAVSRLFNVSVSFKNGQGLHHVDAPECAGCCHGRTGTLIQGTPLTGDGWSFTFADGNVATVCKDKSLGCDGAANIRTDFSLDLLVALPTNRNKDNNKESNAPSPAPTVVTASYGGVGPWLSGTSAEGKCVAKDFSGHTCPLADMTNLTSANVTSGAQCYAAALSTQCTAPAVH